MNEEKARTKRGIKGMGLEETEPGSGIYTCKGPPEDFWRALIYGPRKK